MAFLRSVATTTAIAAASAFPAAVVLSSLSPSSSSSFVSFRFRFPKPQNRAFLSSAPSLLNPNPPFLATSFAQSSSATQMDAPSSEQKPSFQSDGALPELLPLGNAFFSGVKEKLRVADLIGRSIAIYETADKSDSGIAAAVIARSAGVGENYKKLCTCDGTTIWESTGNDFVTSKV